MARGRPFRFAHFGRGLNTTDGVMSLREGDVDDPGGAGAEARELLNVVSRHRGNVSRRDGCTAIAAPLAGGNLALKDISIIGRGAGSFALCSEAGGRLWSISAATPAVPTVIVAAGLSATAPWRFLRAPVTGAQGPAYGMNGTDAPIETDGTLAGTGAWTATTGTLPNGTQLAYHDNEVFVSGVAAFPYRLYWSYPGQPTNWPAANVEDFDPEDGQPLVTHVSHGSSLLVFKRRGIWKVYDSETGANTKVAASVGAVSARSVVSTEVGCFFLDAELGVMVTDGSTVSTVSSQIQRTLDGVPAADMAQAVAAYVAGHYYLSVKVDGVRRILDYDTQLQSWWIHSPTPAALAAWDRGSGPRLVGAPESLLAGASRLIELFTPGQLYDDGTIFESYWTGPFHRINGFRFARGVLRRCRRLTMEGRGTVDVYVAADYANSRGSQEGTPVFTTADDTFGGADTFGGGGTFGGGVQLGQDVIPTLGLAYAFSVGVYSAAAQAWELDAYSFFMDSRKD